MKRSKPLRINWTKVLWWFIFLTLAASVVFISVAMALAPAEPDPASPYRRVKGDYVLMLLQCVVGVLAMLLPSFLRKKWQLVIPSKMMVLFAVFLYCAIFLGEVRAFYYNVPHWDTILHTFSGAMLGALGFSVINFLNRTDRVPVNLSPAFVAFFTLCFILPFPLHSLDASPSSSAWCGSFTSLRRTGSCTRICRNSPSRAASRSSDAPP